MKDLDSLVDRAIRGRDRQALGELFAGLSGEIYGFMLRRASPAEADDLAQETIVQALQGLGTVREPAAFRGWIWRIAIRVAQASWAKRKLQVRVVEEAARRTPTHEEGPEMAHERSESRRQVAKAVEALDDDLRTTVDLRYERGLSYAEIAVAMDCAEGTVGARLNSALKRLQQALAVVGVALTLAMLEGELSAEPAPEVTAGFKRRVDEEVSRAHRRGLRTGRRAGTAALTLVALLFIAGGATVIRGVLRGRTGGGPDARGVVASAPSTSEEVKSTAPAGAPTPGAAGPEVGRSPAAVRGRVTGVVRERDSRKPVAGARVWLQDLPGKSGVDEATHPIGESVTDTGGSFDIDALPGQWELNTEARGYVGLALERYRVALGVNLDSSFVDENEVAAEPGPSALEENQVVVVAGAVTAHDIEIIPGMTVRGTVVDERAAPLEGAHVFVSLFTFDLPARGSMSAGSMELGPDRAEFEVTTGADGRFELTGIFPDSRSTIAAVKEGFARVEMEVSAQALPADLVLATSRLLALSGQVRDSKGSPVSGATVRIKSPPPNGVSLPGLLPEDLLKSWAPCDEEGRYSAKGESSRDAIAAWAPGYGLSLQDLDVPDLSNLPLSLPDSSKSLRGIVRDNAGRPISGARVRVVSLGRKTGRASITLVLPEFADTKWGALADGALPATATSNEATTDGLGGFILTGLALGEGSSAVLTIEADGFLEFPICVEDDAALEVKLTPKKR